MYIQSYYNIQDLILGSQNKTKNIFRFSLQKLFFSQIRLSFEEIKEG